MIREFFQSIRRDIKRWQNKRARAKRVVYTWDRWEHMRSMQNARQRLVQP